MKTETIKDLILSSPENEFFLSKHYYFKFYFDIYYSIIRDDLYTLYGFWIDKKELYFNIKHNTDIIFITNFLFKYTTIYKVGKNKKEIKHTDGVGKKLLFLYIINKFNCNPQQLFNVYGNNEE